MSRLVVEVDDFARAARAMRHEVAENVELCLSAVAGRLQPKLVGVDPAGVAWAADYDPAVRSVLAASALLADGAYKTSQLFAASGRNYALAEHASTTGSSGGAAVSGFEWTQLLADQPPVRVPHVPSAGGAGHDTPADWWLVEHTIGVLWPGGHQDRLRATADAWRSAARGLDAALGVPLRITADFVLDNLPEADGIRTTCTGLYDRLTALTTGHHTLADACDDYATHLDTCHQQVEEELTNLARDTVITQTAGAALSFISFGLAQVPTQAAQAARITLAANRIRTLIEKLVTAAKLLATTIARIRHLADDIHHAMHQLATTRLAYAGITEVPRLRHIERTAMTARDAERGASAATNLAKASDDVPSALRGRKLGDPGVWRKQTSLGRHFNDHGADVDAVDEADYAAKAADFLQQAATKGYLRKVDDEGIIRVYDPHTRMFGSYWPNGSTRTFFRPTRSDYFKDQPGALR